MSWSGTRPADMRHQPPVGKVITGLGRRDDGCGADEGQDCEGSDEWIHGTSKAEDLDEGERSDWLATGDLECL